MKTSFARSVRRRAVPWALGPVTVVLLLAGISRVTIAAETSAPNPLKNAYFGDLHVHTALSFDAFTAGTRILPDDSYRYAQGEAVEYLGRKVKRKAPLDFLAVTDHAEYLGTARKIADPNGPFKDTELSRLLNNPDPKAFIAAFKSFAKAVADRDFHGYDLLSDDVVKGNWQLVIDAAEKHYRPGKFTTFIAYEWSSTPGSQNLHRNVIFRNNKVPDRPFSAIDSHEPEALWNFLEAQRRNGYEALAINHNANASNGLMFDFKDSSANPITPEYAGLRNRNEPLAEVVQTKGQSETHPLLSPTDEFSDYEIWSRLLATTRTGAIDGSYVRQAYGRGLEIASRISANPFKFGLVGASDVHSGLSSTEEDNYLGISPQDRSAQVVLANTKDSLAGEPAIVFSAAGLTGVWAEANTREAIFDALKRKEVFATSGNRITVRFFAGWNLPKDLVQQADWVKTAYALGVPMGSDLPAGPQDAAPKFAVQAVKDPNSGNLDRIQIVKVWSKAGKSFEKVFDVVWAGKRNIDRETGKLPPVGNTVDVKTATYKNAIGATELVTVWQDPEFDAGAPAVYYVRVLEIPTPRWTTYWAVQAGLPLPERVPATIQERAWTSPIFYKAS